jgi:hypothetical protein
MLTRYITNREVADNLPIPPNHTSSTAKCKRVKEILKELALLKKELASLVTPRSAT